MARVYDFWLGGTDNFEADRAVAGQVAAVYPDVLAAVRAQRAFLARCTSWSQRQVSGSSWTSDWVALGEQHSSGRPAGGAAITGGVCGQRPDRAQPRPGLTDQQPGGATDYIDADLRATGEVAEGVQRYNEQAAAPVAARTRAGVRRFFAGLDLVEPGVVQVHRWRPTAGDLGNDRDLAIYAGVARKP